MNKRQKFFSVIGALLITAFAMMGTIVDFVVDYQWFKDLGYTDAFMVKVWAYIQMGLPLWGITAICFAAYFMWVERQYFKLVHIVVDPKQRSNKVYRKLAVFAAVFTTFVLSLMTTGGLWFDILRFMRAVPFGQADPLFGKDIAFYVFQLPLYNKIIGFAVLYLVVLALATVGINLILMTLKPPTDLDFSAFSNVRTLHDVRGVAKKGLVASLIIKIGLFGFLICLLLIPYYWLAKYNLVFSPRGGAYGASYTDVHVMLPSYWALLIVTVIGAAAFLYGLLSKRYRLMLVGPIGLITVSLLSGVVAMVVQNLMVEPDEVAKERPYLEYNIALTRQAYKLDAIEELDYPVAETLNRDMLTKNKDVIDNIRINDYRPMLKTYNQVQGIRLYYQFFDIDTDRYMIDGKLTQVLLAAREINTDKLEVQTWQNRHIKFTHGYGVALSPVNAVSPDGLPKLLIKNIPPESPEVPALKISQPEIYFGEMTKDYIIVNTSEKEFDYPKGSDNQETMYAGDAGIELGFWNRVLFSIYKGDLRLLTSSIITPDSRMIMRRSVDERLAFLAPYIQFDKDPYVVIDESNGKLMWIVDGYTQTRNFPYAQPYDATGVNYVRNSVKAVIDAYTGEASLYIFDEEDPLVATYSAMFPNLFKPQSEFPQTLVAHIRYPKEMMQIQAEVYRKYHMLNPSVFYNAEDMWAIGTELYMDATEVAPIHPDYAVFRLPEKDSLEFLLTIPYTPKDKPNMSSLLVARSDVGADAYGKLFLMKFPKDRTVTGPAMLESKIDQDSIISPQLSLWDQKGSTVLRGNILVVPIEGNLLYIEPVYLQAQNQESLPEMKQVVAAYGDKVVMAPTLAEALGRIFGAEAEAGAEPGAGDGPSAGAGLSNAQLQELLGNALEQYEKASAELDALKKTLEKLQESIPANGEPEVAPTEAPPAGETAPKNP